MENICGRKSLCIEGLYETSGTHFSNKNIQLDESMKKETEGVLQVILFGLNNSIDEHLFDDSLIKLWFF